MANTTNFGWETPDDTDLVKDGAAAMRTLGNAIDTSFVDLKGGTTGQVLSKASNTDLDYTWVTTDDANAIQNAIVDAKGDLIAASAADTPARLAVGSNGDTLVADSASSTGLRWQGNYAAGKNKIINGDFGIWQRGTSFSNPANGSFSSDRWSWGTNGSGVTATISQQTFTPGTAPVSGYEGQFFWRYNQTAAGSGNTVNILVNKCEDVRTLAGQTVTLSFWGKADSSRTLSVDLEQDFGSGGSSAVSSSSSNLSFTTSWTRFTYTVTLASVSGKTIGTGSSLKMRLFLPAGTTSTIDIWGVQLEAGSVATAFQTATGTLAGELAACQRYYQTFGGGCQGAWDSTTTAILFAQCVVPMRTAPTLTLAASAFTFGVQGGSNLTSSGSAIAFSSIGANGFRVGINGFTGATQYRGCWVATQSTEVVTASAEL